MRENLANNHQIYPDTTIFEIAAPRIDFVMTLSDKGEIDVKTKDISRKINVIKCYPKSTLTQKTKVTNREIKPTPHAIIREDTNSTLKKDRLFSDPILQEYHSTTSTIPPITFKGTIIKSNQNNWLVGLLLFSFLLLTVIRYSYNKYLTKIVHSTFNYQIIWNLFNEKNMSNIMGAFILNVIFFINGAIFLYEIISYNNLASSSRHGFNLYLFCLGILVGIYLMKLLGFYLAGQIFKGSKEINEYLHTVFIYNKNLGLLLLPIITSIPFIKPFAIPLLIKAGLVLALFFYLLRILQGIKILFRKHVSIFYMILYLCALEILPLLMIFKLLVSWV